MIVLGIESSCDETGVAIYDAALGLRAHAVHSQVDLHARYGGVVPELASRDHIQRVVPLVREVMANAGVQSTDLSAVAYTRGPGLVGALLVGGGFRFVASVRLELTCHSGPSYGRSFAGTDVRAGPSDLSFPRAARVRGTHVARRGCRCWSVQDLRSVVGRCGW